MNGKGLIWLLSIIIGFLLLATISCGGSSTLSIGERVTNTAVGNGPGGGFSPQGDDPLPEIPLPPASEIEDPQQDPNPPSPLQGESVAFYTWESDGSFVVKEQFAGFTGVEPPWDSNILPLSEFQAQYGSSIPLVPRTPYSGLVIYDPYHLSVEELNIDDDLQFLIEPGMSEEEAFQAVLSYVRNTAEGESNCFSKGSL